MSAHTADGTPLAPRSLALNVGVMCPVCRHIVPSREAVLDDGGAYHRRCLEFGPRCAFCAKAIAPGSHTMRIGLTQFHARCGEALSWSAATSTVGPVDAPVVPVEP